MTGNADLGPDTTEAIARKLGRYPGPAWRKAYLSELLRSGGLFLSAGNARGAQYCFAKVAKGLESLEECPDEPAAASGEAEAYPSYAKGTPPGPRAEPGEGRLTAMERIRRQWRLERIEDAATVLRKHGDRLSALENQSYRERLERLRQSGQAASTEAQSERADAGIRDLRRRLYQRVLKSQKISLARRRLPLTFRLALPPSSQGGAPADSPLPGPSAKVRVDAEWGPAVGPYNDRYNMEDLLSLIAAADAAWVHELLDLYRGLADVQGLLPQTAPARK